MAEHALSTGRLFLSHHLDRPLFAQIGNRSVLNKRNSYDRTMPKDPPIELTDIATIGSAFASLSVNKVFGLDEAAVAAEAMGGRIGTHLSVRRQERRAYLIEPAGGCGERITQLRSIA